MEQQTTLIKQQTVLNQRVVHLIQGADRIVKGMDGIQHEVGNLSQTLHGILDDISRG